MVSIGILVAFGIVLGYAFLLLYLTTTRPRGSATQSIEKLTILIPFKNEAENLDLLLGQLANMSFSDIAISVICVNDHSTDNWQNMIHSVILNMDVLNLPKHLHGKKAAVSFGISHSKTPWILTLDADVELTSNFFSIIKNGIPEKAKYCLLPITANRANGFVRAFFDLEFLALHFIGLKSSQAGKPLLSNAACSLVSREAYLTTISQRTDWHISSGDDVFSMFAIFDMYKSSSIQAMNTENGVMAKVDFPTNLTRLWKQRLRWIGKSSRINNSWFSIVSLLTISFNMVFIYAIIVTLAESITDRILIILLIPFFVQSIFLAIVANTLERRDLLKWIIPAVFIYPFYLLALVITQIFWKPNWK